MISTRDDDIPRHSSFNPSPAQSLHQQWNVPIASFFVTTVLREGVYLEKYSNMGVHGFHLLPVYFSLKSFFKNTHNMVYLYKDCLKRWSWMVLKVNNNQTKPIKAFPIQIDAVWINWGLLNCIFYKMFSTLFLLFCLQTWYLSPNLHADRHFAVHR